jgi:hypothetical protein
MNAMKNLTLLIVGSFIASLSFSQVQRKAAVANKPDSAAITADRKTLSGKEKIKVARELDLNKEQKSKLKEIRQSAKVKKEAVENDDKLSATEKQAKLKELQREQLKSTMSILNDEQKEKMKEMRKNKKGQQMEEEN